MQVIRIFPADFVETWELQKKLRGQLIANQATQEECLILAEHPATITMGRSAKAENIFENNLNIPCHKLERGGDVTYHGPGQLIAYPIFDLNRHRRDVGWFMRQLEQVVIATLAELQISAIRVPGRTGVWIDSKTKICSIGVHLSRWCSMHGLSLNVTNQSLAGFTCINPCGLGPIKLTSIEEQGPLLSVMQVADICENAFREYFKFG